MLNKKIIVLTIFLVSLLAISAVSATDNVTDEIIGVDDAGDNIVSVENYDGPDELGSDVNDVVLTANPKTFTDLNNLINGNNNHDVYLEGNYTFVSGTDNNFKEGIAVSRSVTIYGNGFTLDGSRNARIFDVSSSNVVFRDIVFVNGKSTGSGGAINIGKSCMAVNAINCTFINNSAFVIKNGNQYTPGYGGAIYGGKINTCTAVNCTFINNAVDKYGEGGAVAFVDVYNCIFINNTSNSSGGVMYGACAAVNCTFINNSAVLYGGAMDSGSAVNCTFINNTAGRDGGAMAGGSAVNCSFIDNSAKRNGGAMYYYNGGSAVNCLFTGNSADDDGGAIHGYKFSAVNCSFIDNSAKRNGGAMSMSSGGSAENCTFINNSAVKNGGAIYSGSSFSAVNCDFIGNFANSCGAIYGNYTDLNCTFVNNSDNAPKTFTMLNDLINGNTGSEVYLDANYTFVSVTDDIFKEGIEINRELTVWGNGFTVSGNYVARIFSVSHSNVVFRDIVFVNGKSPDDEDDGGGAINGACTAVNCTFTDNSAYGYGGAMNGGTAVNCTFTDNSAGGEGGAMNGGTAVNCTFTNNYAFGGGAMNEGTAENCTFINNAADEGGAMYGSSCYAVNCIFEGNTVHEEGGAMHDGSAVNCTFINNSAIWGGAIEDGSAVNCTFINNNACRHNEFGDGGAMHGSKCNAVNCTFINNCAFDSGGAMSGGSAVDCYFRGNSAEMGGAMNRGTASNCIFKDNYAESFGDNTYNTVILDKSATTITASNVIANYGTAENIIVSLTNSRGEPISDAVLSVDLNGVKSFTTDSNGQISPTTDGLPAGRHTAVITFAGDDYYSNSSKSINVVVNRINAQLMVNVNDISFGDDLVVNVQSQSNIRYRVNVSVGGMYKLVSLKNGSGSAKFSGLNRGTYVVTAYYGGYFVGDDNYLNSSASATVKVNRVSANIQVFADSIAFGDDLFVYVQSLSDIKYRVNVSVGGMYKLVSLKNGLGSVKFSGLAVGTYTVTAYYGGYFVGDDNYLNSSASVTVKVNKHNPNIQVTADTIVHGEDLVVNVQLPSDVSRRVNVSLSNGESKLVSLKNGVGSVKFSGLAVGTYTVTASYGGDAIYSKSSASTTVKVNKANPNIWVTADSIVYGDDLVVNVKLPSDVSRRVTVCINGESQLVSLKNGVGSVKFTGLAAGTYTIETSYGGDSNYLKSSVNTTVKVTKAVPEIQVTANDITYGETLTVGVKLPADVLKRAVLKIDGQSQYVSLKNGVGSVKIKGLSVGTHEIEVSYAGDTNYKKASFTTSVEVEN